METVNVTPTVAPAFFPGSNRRVILGSPTLQTTSRRICIPIRMPLTGESFVGVPDWVSEAFDAVSKYLSEASPNVQQIADLMLAFHNDSPKDELFAPPSAKAPGCELKAFAVARVENPDDDPEVELQFKAYIPFTRDIWQWIGEMAGHEVFMAFPSSMSGKVKTTSKPTSAEADTLKGDTNPPADAPAKSKSKKSGPKELAAYHASVN